MAVPNFRARRAFFRLQTGLKRSSHRPQVEQLEPRQLLTGVELMSIDITGDSAGTALPITATNPAINFSGRFVAFQSDATDLVSGITDTNGGTDVFVRDRLLGTTTVISVVPGGGRTGSSRSFDPSISDDGRYIAFGSAATDLLSLPIVIDAPANVYVRDRDTDKDGIFDEPGATSTRLLSLSALGTGDGSGVFGGPSGGDAFGFGVEALRPRISGNGLYVTFGSFASNLSPGIVDANFTIDVFRVPTSGGVSPTMVSDDFEGEISGANGIPAPFSNAPDISRDGRFIAFVSAANNLHEVVEDTLDGTEPDIYVHDEKTGFATLMSVNVSGDDGGDAASVDPDLSTDGRYVVWESSATDLTAPGVNTNGLALDVFRKKVSGGAVELVSITAGGRTGGGASENPSISDNGRFVAFQSEATDLITDPEQLAAGVEDANGEPDVYVRDMLLKTTALVSINSIGTASGMGGTAGLFGTSLNPVISGNGRYVVFESFAEDLVAGTVAVGRNLFVRDIVSGVTRLASEDSDPGDLNDSGGNLISSLFQQVISNDGAIVAFKGDAPDLVLPDSNAAADVFAFEGTPDLIAYSSSASASTSSTVIIKYERELSPLIGPFEFAFYISTDELFSPDDTLVGSRLATGTTRPNYVVDLATATDFALPGEGLPDLDTDYFLIGVVDHLDPDTIEEADADDYNEDNTTTFFTDYHVAGTPWMVHGTAAGDVISYAAAAPSLTLTYNGRTRTLPLASVPTTRIRAHDGDDTVTGSPLADLIHGGAGNDTLSGGDENDTINGGLGNDIIVGGMGDDTLFDGPGDDLLDVGVGLDVVFYTPGSDDILVDGGGLDTIDLSLDDQLITLDLDSTAVQTVDLAGNTVRLIGQWENFVGSPFGNKLTVRPIPTERHLQGGAGPNDKLIVDVGGNPVVDDGVKVDVPGFGSIFYAGFEEVVVIGGAPRIVDDSDSPPLFTAPGFFPSDPMFPQGFAAGVHFSAAGSGNTATWTFSDLAPGQYAVATTWTFAGDRAKDSPFTIREGGPAGNVLATLDVNQEQNPGEFDPAEDGQNILFRNLAIVTTSATGLTVQLTDVGADQFVAADAIRIEPVRATRLLDDGAIGFAATGFVPQTLPNNLPNRGGFGDVHIGDTVGETATYSFSGLSPGTYDISATWTTGFDRATNASFSAQNGSGGTVTSQVNQQFPPTDFVEAGLPWGRLARVVVGADGLLTLRWNVPIGVDGLVIADAVRIDPAPQLEVSVSDFEQDTEPVFAGFGLIGARAMPGTPITSGQTVTVDNRPDGTTDFTTILGVPVHNRGLQPLRVSPPQVTGAGFNLHNGAQPQIIPPGGFGLFLVDYLVTTLGTGSADINFNDGPFSSSPFTFTLNVPVVTDNSPPTVGIISPSAGDLVIEGQPLQLKATATDDLGIERVEFLVNGVVQATHTQEPFDFTFQPPPVTAVTPFALVVRAVDRGGNSTDSTGVMVDVVPDAPPTVDLVAPQAGDAVIEGEVLRVVADVFDDVAIRRVEFLMNGVVVATDDTSGDRFLGDVPVSLMGTSARLQVRAVDTAGQTTESEPIELNQFDDTPPTVHIVSPNDGQQVIEGRQVVVQVAANDDLQVARVDLIVGDQIVQADLPMIGGLFRGQFVAPAGLGTLDVRALAVDALGNMTNSTLVQLTVVPTRGMARVIQQGGILRLIGSNQSDQVQVTATGTGRVLVTGLNGTTLNRLTTPIQFQNISLILGDFGGDHDLVRLDAAAPNHRLPITNLNLGAGSDTVEVQNAQLANSLTIFAGAGNDTFTATGARLQTFVFFGGDGQDQVDLQNSIVQGFSSVVLEAGTNQFRATDTAFRGGLSVLGGAQRDIVDLTRVTGQSVMTFTLGQGADEFRAVDSTFQRVLSVLLGTGDNRLDFDDVTALDTVAIIAGGDDDVLNILASDLARLCLFAGVGDDDVVNLTGTRVRRSLGIFR